MRRKNVWEHLWEQLRESTEGPTVTLQVPRDVADQLLSMLSTSLEVDDMGGEGDEDMGFEPDADDFGGPPDGDEDDMGGFSAGEDGPGFSFGDEDDEEDDSDDDDSDDDSEDEDDDEEDEEDDETDEAFDYSRSGGNPSGLRTKTAFGEQRIRRAPIRSRSRMR